ncbi:OmpL47-type beta-barrel domain-containing protein [Cryobacterium tepidiphilum]|uniref:Ig-like domain-containing protein n=1 Tax=Cryobacterium tepidiphilum TaxID=2486026 RepID=A0A3M8LMI4_9MICO|nr:PxKF domain-containing protein [Cryobacterium tepidiphilum]RNE66733.1 hypothetical protein EEJ31_02820 [Cryobacterium tepidiphilum]
MNALPARSLPDQPASARGALHPSRRLAWTALAAVLAVIVGGVNAPAALAADVTGTSFSGGAGTVSVAGTLYAKNGAAVTLTVTTSSDTKCVDVSGAFAGHQTSATAKSVWTFTTTAGTGDGAQGITALAAASFNKNDACTGPSRSLQGSYTLDNTGPTVTAALTPVANGAGWNKATTTVAWTAADAGSGVASGPTPSGSTESANGTVTRTSTATDRLGNTGTGSVTVRIDKSAPTITGSQAKNADGTTTVTFTCADPGSGSGISSCLADGATTNVKTVQPGTTVGGTATDAAGNVAKTSVTVAAGDTTAPTLSGAPTMAPGSGGWYSGDVTVRWSAADPESGIPASVADTVITGEGAGLTSTTTVANGAGLSTTATSTAVNIDRTAPATSITGASNSWVNGSVTVELSATDNLSGVARTEYTVDGGATQAGSRFTLTDDGDHTITFRSVDKAGNAEATQSAQVRIDRAAPGIGHEFTPTSYRDGAWTNTDVTVTFTCTDQGGSGVADCTAPVTTSAEGTRTVNGTATDGAGNTATDSVSVRIDKTAPSISAVASGVRNAAGWYNDDVTVTYTATDDVSGVTRAPDNDTLGEGAGQAASATATDAAGNAATAGVTGINIDKTPPTLTATVPDGWHTDDVTVAWTCTDVLSGPADQPADDVVTGEGDNLSATASCTDRAGNVTTKTVSGIRIDRSAPTTTADVPAALASGWHGAAVPVTLAGSDNLSETVTTRYTIDGGDPQTYKGPFTLSADGVHRIVFWSIDAAGNMETAGAPLTVKVDTVAPTTTLVDPTTPATGWFVTSGIPVAFDAADAGSGVAATYYTIDGGAPQVYGRPFTADLSTGTHTISYWSVDLADNREARESTNTVAVNVDTDAPTISGAARPAANGRGWNNTDVAVTFSCDDVGSGLPSGVAGCAGDAVLSNDGAGQSVRGDAVDVAGNRSSTSYGPVNIDQTKPTLTGVPADGNGAGWHNDDVPVTWVGDDGLSGIDAASQPGPSLITGEGANLGAGPVTITDNAGNISAEARVSGVKIDRTAPTITGAPVQRPNGAGWFTSDVTVNFTCTDALSGVASCPTSRLVAGDGANQSVTSDPATDVAGNASAGATVSGINIDGTAPSTTSNNTCSAVNDFCTGDTATVLLTATDQAGLSGVKEIHYSVDGGTEQVAPGTTATVAVPLTGSGAGSVRYYAVDKAGNVESANGVALKWDNIAPTVDHALSPKPNAAEWNKADVTVTFTAKDDDKGSGVVKVTAPVTVSTETSGRVVTGTAKDTAGNVGTDAVTVRLDKTAPRITGAVTSGTLTASGWYNGPVTVTFTCADGLSGIATCPDPMVLTANGANTASGTATDNAGNTAEAVVDGIRIDREKPTLTTKDVNVAGAIYTLGAVPAAGCSATDSFSGVVSCTVTVAGGNANGVGTFTYSATAADKAGNTAVITGTFTVIYRFDGFLQPINDTAHQVGVSTSVFKAGSNVPVKFQLKNASGSVVQAASAPAWVTPVKGAAMSAPVDESVYPTAADSGSTYKYDATARQYQYNWKTGNASGNYWRIGVTLDDGQTYYVNIGLR